MRDNHFLIEARSGQKKRKIKGMKQMAASGAGWHQDVK